ncbi:phenolphthiocerol synthesis polyketide synthase type I Pks15/1-like [Stigmatopora nigra]
MEAPEDAIAVVGIGCNFPGGEGLENFWKVLVNGRNCSVPIPRERFDTAAWYHPDDNQAGKSRTAKAALVDGFNLFDHKFFGIGDSEVEQMDPQHKQLLQCVYRALENAGLPVEKASGTRTGVYFGLMNRDYETTASHLAPGTIDHWTGTGLAMSIAANRVSYVFDFTGPSFALDCACSSSLVALHQACQAIRHGDCEMALCGGVNCIIEPRVFVALSKAKMISPDGTSKPFSNMADGYGRGEGCGVVLLKPLSKALRDRDHIWGVIDKTAVNQDGRSVSPITKPSVTRQEALLRSVYSQRDLGAVHYVEAHGTGTPVGDLAEVAGLSLVLAGGRARTRALRIGSVKGNIGHTESAAGVAGLIKVLLMMKHGTFVPSLFYSEETAGVDFRACDVRVVRDVEKWEAGEGRVAGINNFGFGGTNAHVVVSQHQPPPPPTAAVKNGGGKLKFLVMSANSPKSLALTLEDTARRLQDDTDLDALLYTAACRRSHLRHRYRRALTVSSVGDLGQKLRAAAVQDLQRPSLKEPKLVFVFCGNGLAYHGMGQRLLQREPVFRDKIREVSGHLRQLGGPDISEVLESQTEHADFGRADVAQALLFALQVGVVALLDHWGVRAHAALGHSAGEVAAAHCSGRLSLEDAVKVVHFRGLLQREVTGGQMLVIGNMAVSRVRALLSAFSGRLCVAAHNSPRSCTVSGDADAIQNLRARLSDSADGPKLFLRTLDVPAAYHSHLMDPILPKIREAIGSLRENQTDTQLFSGVTGREAEPGDFCTGDYWARNVRDPVAFRRSVEAAARGEKRAVFVEIGPRPALRRNIAETLGEDAAVVASLRPGKEHQTLSSAVARLFELGVHVDWERYYSGYERPPLHFPRYQFDSSERDVVIEGARKNTAGGRNPHPLLRAAWNEADTFHCDLTSDSAFYLKEHRHKKVPVVPGAFYAELALAACASCAQPKVPLNRLRLDVAFHSPFVLAPNRPEMKVRVDRKEDGARFGVFSSAATYASGTVTFLKEPAVEERHVDLSAVAKRCRSVVTQRDFYADLAQGGFQYGEVFTNKADVHYGEDLKEAFVLVTVPQALRSDLHEYCVHPVVLDFLMQLLPVTVEHVFAGRPGFPAKIGSLTVLEPLQEEMALYLRASNVRADHFEVCGCFADRQGRTLVEVKHVLIKYLGSPTQVVDQYFYHNDFSAVPEKICEDLPPTALVFADQMGMAEALKPHLDPRSKYIPSNRAQDILDRGFPWLLGELQLTDLRDFGEVLFLWGQEKLDSLAPESVLGSLADCCEILRQVMLELKRLDFPNSIRAVTYRCSELTAEHVNPGFAVVGATRALQAEVAELSIQLVDLDSVGAEDVSALSEILRGYPCGEYPELVVKGGVVLKPSIARTPAEPSEVFEGTPASDSSEPRVLQTADAFKMSDLSAFPVHAEAEPMGATWMEIRPVGFCVHSSEYFPVSSSHLKFGQTLYWDRHCSQKHQLLLLDFSGTVTKVGTEVRKVKVGDPVICCFPSVAADRVRVPQEACYPATKQLSFLQNTPCVSYFVLAWEVLFGVLPRAKRNLGIVSPVSDSALVKVLTVASQKSGWDVLVTGTDGSFEGWPTQMDALVVLPPLDKSLMAHVRQFPGAKNVVLLGGSQSLLAENELYDLEESVQVQTLDMASLLSKGSLCARRLRVYHWLKSLNLNKSFFLDSFTFQGDASQKIPGCPSETPESYFHARKLAVVALEKGPAGASKIPLVRSEKPLFRKRAVYIVAGGLSGLGFETLRFISQKGGGVVVTLSRSQPSDQVRREIRNVEKRCGNSVLTVQCDIGAAQQVQEAFRAVRLKFPGYPVRGVFHSAVVLHDALIESLDRGAYEKVLKPKVNGVLNLHRATLGCALDYFVCYSSISAFLGNASQSNYAAANTFLDLFCQYRRRLGLPAQSVNWGALNLGLLLDKELFQRFLEAKGMMVLTLGEIHQSLEQCLILKRPQQAVCRFHFRNIRFNVLSQNVALSARLSGLVERALRESGESASRGECGQEEVPIRDYAASLLSRTVGVDVKLLRDDTPLSSLGTDSMQAMTLQNRIFQDRGVSVPLVKLLDPNATLATVVAILSEASEGGSKEVLSTRL